MPFFFFFLVGFCQNDEPSTSSDTREQQHDSDSEDANSNANVSEMDVSEPLVAKPSPKSGCGPAGRFVQTGVQVLTTAATIPGAVYLLNIGYNAAMSYFAPASPATGGAGNFSAPDFGNASGPTGGFSAPINPFLSGTVNFWRS